MECRKARGIPMHGRKPGAWSNGRKCGVYTGARRAAFPVPARAHGPCADMAAVTAFPGSPALSAMTRPLPVATCHAASGSGEGPRATGAGSEASGCSSTRRVKEASAEVPRPAPLRQRSGRSSEESSVLLADPRCSSGDATSALSSGLSHTVRQARAPAHRSPGSRDVLRRAHVFSRLSWVISLDISMRVQQPSFIPWRTVPEDNGTPAMKHEQAHAWKPIDAMDSYPLTLCNAGFCNHGTPFVT